MPYLVLIRRGGEQMFTKLDEATALQPLLVGRGRLCGLQVPDRSVARHQAAVFRDGERWRMVDRSGKLTSVNGKPVESAWLSHGDRLDLGPYRVHFQDAELPDEADEPSRIRTVVDPRGKPVELPSQLWLKAQPVLGGPVEQIFLGERATIGAGAGCDLRLRNSRGLSQEHARVWRDGGRLFLEDAGSTNGTWAKGLSIREAELPVEERFQAGGHRCWVSDTKEEGEAPAWSFEGIIGRSERMLQMFERIVAVAASDASVLVTGESGSGKDLVARAIHRRSNRAAGPFVPVNCGAISPQVMESHLFGHEKGAFTGASEASPGLIAQADGGTIFLDEIGDMPLELQVKVLRTVELGELLRVGAPKPIYVDVRFIAGTHRDLAALVRVGRFREDLFFRLNVLSVAVPPLRARFEDLPFLWEYLAKKHARRNLRPVLTPEVLDLLLAYHWPGNVRELENIVERALALMTSQELLPEHIVFDANAAPLPPPVESFLTDALSLEQVEVLTLRAALQRNRGNRTKAAEELKISRSTLKRKIIEHGLEREGLGDADEGEGPGEGEE